MAEVTIELDEDNQTHTPFTDLPEPKLMLLAPPAPFLPRPGRPAVPWDRWLRSFERYLDSLEKAFLLDSAKCLLLQHNLGQEGNRVCAKLLHGNTNYREARSTLTTYFRQHRDVQLLDDGALSWADTELVGELRDGPAPSLLLSIQTSDEEHNRHQVQQLSGKRRSDRLKTRKHLSIKAPSTWSEHMDDSPYYDYEDKDITKIDWEPAGDNSSVDSDSPNNEIDEVFHSSSMTKGNFTNDDLFCCPDCSKSFGRKDHLRRHMKDKHGHATYTCSVCKETVGSHKELLAHREGHPKLLACPICIDRTFTKPSRLARHMRSHSNDKPFSCPVCGALFSQGDHLRRHQKTQHSKFTFICSICGESAGSFKEMQTHKNNHPCSFACPTCDQRFPSESEMLSHVRSHCDELTEKDNHDENQHCATWLRTQNSVVSDDTRHTEGGTDAQVAHSNDKHEGHMEAEEEMAVDGSRPAGGGVEEEYEDCNGGDAKPVRKRSRGYSCPICVNKSFIVPSKLARHMRSHTKEKPFCCKICRKVFSHVYHLRRHLRVQHSQFVCLKCGTGFASVEELDEHKETHSSTNHPCPHCDRIFYTEDALSRHAPSHSHDDQQAHLDYAKWRQAFADLVSYDVHMETNEPSKTSQRYECPYCLKAVASWRTQQKHLAAHGKEIKGTCAECDETCGSLEELRTHMESHKRSYSCAPCGKQFKLESALKKHEQVHQDKRFYCTLCNQDFVKSSHFKKHMQCHAKRESKCPHCNGVFLRLTAFKSHLRSHVEERPYQCPCCIECFTVKSDFEKHCLKHKTFKRANPFSCTRCDQAFPTLRELKAHMEQHTDEPVLSCPHCGKLHLNKAKLERHVSIHTGERPHLCSICGQGFTGPMFLKLHMVVHTSEKPHHCALCNKRFKSRSGLRAHSVRHLAVPPRFSCSECGRSYGRMVELRMHQRYHTGDKAHKCLCCSKRFISHHKLKVHMRTHTGERPYACPQCAQTFTQAGDRNRHVNKYH